MSADGEAAPSGRYAFLRTRRWVGLIALLVTASVACVLLGHWQWGRYVERHAEAEQVNAVYDAQPLPLDEALGTAAGGSPTPTVGPGDEWQPVRLRGHYVEDGTVLLRNRPVDGTPAVHVIAPFVAETGAGEVLVVVDRGWIPAEVADTGGEVPRPPAGEVTLTARLREPEQPSDRDQPHGQVYTLDPGQVLQAVRGVTDLAPVAGLPVLDGYVVASAEDPAPAVAVGGYTRPESKHVMNISYAFQWWIFAAGFLLSLVVLARREAAERSGHGPVRRLSRAEFDEDLEIYTQLQARAALPAGARGADLGAGAPRGDRLVDASSAPDDTLRGQRVIEATAFEVSPEAEADRSAGRSGQAPPSSRPES
ncbi:cytochrome oxidase assembly protein ShyY1 [Georgenia soli]|uniref:SURF1-like protein n=1 Tax=Georgenia soli TaxID=638953 RepID=A0A2A9EJ95_9MICO|nr:SURF1 family protein [Georgenia soli]PFG38320.1 cytochrome oxidase assembly protein ShyY1 [Georgenia soli]